MKIRVTDNKDKFESFEIEGKDGIEIEEKLLDWYLELSNWDDTVEMVESNCNCRITILDPTEEEL